jgi:hypothetical protein
MIFRAPARARSRARKLGYARCLVFQEIAKTHYPLKFMVHPEN